MAGIRSKTSVGAEILHGDFGNGFRCSQLCKRAVRETTNTISCPGMRTGRAARGRKE